MNGPSKLNKYSWDIEISAKAYISTNLGWVGVGGGGGGY